MTGEIQVIGGFVIAFLTWWGGMRAERWKADKEAKSVAKDKDADAWNRFKETIADMRAEIQALRTELKDSEARSDKATDECDKRVEVVRASFEGDLTQARSKIMALSKVCFDQQIGMDAMGIEQSRLKRIVEEHQPIPGGRRATDRQVLATDDGTPTERLQP